MYLFVNFLYLLYMQLLQDTHNFCKTHTTSAAYLNIYINAATYIQLLQCAENNLNIHSDKMSNAYSYPKIIKTQVK